jgi:hypothetical protein
LPKSKRIAANRDLVVIAQPGWLVNAPFVQERAVTAAQINEPECAAAFRMNDRMQPGDLYRIENQRIQRRSAD